MQSFFKSIVLFLCYSLLIVSCSSDSSNNDTPTSIESKDIVEGEILSFIETYNKGLKPSCSMDEVKKYDADITDYSPNGVSIGFKSATERGDFQIEKMYEKRNAESNELKKSTVYLSRNIYDGTEEENIIQEKVISLEKYVDVVNKHLSGATFKKFNGTDTWELGDHSFSLYYVNGDGSDILFEVIKY